LLGFLVHCNEIDQTFSSMVYLSTYVHSNLATFVPTQDRPFVVKSVIKMDIPLNVSSACDVPAVAMAVRMALKNALPRMHV
jgi:hypothetical protein